MDLFAVNRRGSWGVVGDVKMIAGITENRQTLKQILQGLNLRLQIKGK